MRNRTKGMPKLGYATNAHKVWVDRAPPFFVNVKWSNKAGTVKLVKAADVKGK